MADTWFSTQLLQIPPVTGARWLRMYGSLMAATRPQRHMFGAGDRRPGNERDWTKQWNPVAMHVRLPRFSLPVAGRGFGEGLFLPLPDEPRQHARISRFCDAKPAQCCPLACCSSLALPLPPAPSLPVLLLSYVHALWVSHKEDLSFVEFVPQKTVF
jgi:hypothetical protein